MLTHLLVTALIELEVVFEVVEVAVEARLESETIYDVKLPPQHDTSGFKFGRFESEATRVVPELLSLLSQKFGDYSHFQVVRRVQGRLGSVNKYVLLS